MLNTRKRKIKKLFNMMNNQNERVIVLLPDLAKLIDFSLSTEELDYLLKFGNGKYTYDEVKLLSGLPTAQWADMFQDLIKKGFIYVEYGPNDNNTYLLSPVMVGWYETQAFYYMNSGDENLDLDYIRGFDKYLQYAQKLSVFPLRNISNRVMKRITLPNQSTGILEPKTNEDKKVININQKLDAPESSIYPDQTINDMIEEYGKKDNIFLFPCICRRKAEIMGNPCKFDLEIETCFAFGNLGRYWLESGYGRNIDKSEALELLHRLNEHGVLHNVLHENCNTDNPPWQICNCCWDCCSIMGAYNMGATPLNYQCFYMAQIKTGTTCAGCKKCEDRCPTAAISIIEKQPKLKEHLCIGCGQCVNHCHKGSWELVPQKRNVYLPIVKKSRRRV